MATANIKLIKAIRIAADKIEKGGQYQWGHMGACNCGHLAQELTTYSKREIHEYAMRKSGDWTDQVEDYCYDSGMPMDMIISSMMQSGLERKDMIDLERLKNQEVRQYMGERGIDLNYNKKEDVIAYMKAWANYLEDQLAEKVNIPSIEFEGLETAAEVH